MCSKTLPTIQVELNFKMTNKNNDILYCLIMYNKKVYFFLHLQFKSDSNLILKFMICYHKFDNLRTDSWMKD